jgi:glutamate-1-semialdehyde 2,1-aminomutase
VAAGLATLQALKELNPYPALDKTCAAFTDALRDQFEAKGITVQIPQLGSLFCFFFSGQPIRSFEDVQGCDADTFRKMFHALLERGVYLPPSPFETCFISHAHTGEVLDQALSAFADSIQTL